MGSSSVAQPWHAGERIMQEKQGTVAFSNEVGPRFIHKVIPPHHRPLLNEIPHLMLSFYDPSTSAVWPSVVFGQPGFVDGSMSDGRSVTIAASLHPLDGAIVNGLLKPGVLVGGLAINPMNRDRNRFNGVVGKVNANGHFTIQVTQAFGNCSKYITRRWPMDMDNKTHEKDLVESNVESNSIEAEAAEVIAGSDNMYFGTGTAKSGADMNLRGGTPGFVRTLHAGKTLCWPDYTGNGFYMSLGNVQLQKSAGVIFVDWDESGRGVQVVGEVQTFEKNEVLDPEMQRVLEEEPQALRLVSMSVRKVRSIPHYCPYKYERVELSPYNPRPAGSGPQYIAVLQWVEEESKGVKTFEFQLAPSPLPGSVVMKPGQHVRLALPSLQKPGDALPERTWTVTSSPQWFADHARFQISVKHKEGGLASTMLHHGNWSKEEGLKLDFLGFAGEFGPQLDPSSGKLREEIPNHIVFLVAGIGVTPAVAAVKAVGEAAPRPQTLTIFYSIRSLDEAPFLQTFVKLAPELQKLGVSMRVVVHITGPNAKEEKQALEVGLKVHGAATMKVETGRLSNANQLLKLLPAEAVSRKDSIEGFVCGPLGYESFVVELWSQAGLPPKVLRTESFAY